MRLTFILAGVACCFLSSAGVARSGADALDRDTEAAVKEIQAALSKEPDLENGKQVYTLCIVCHGPEGWGRPDGSYPQIAGQLSKVTIKQLADIRAGNRSNPIMLPFSNPKTLGGPQEIADVAAYIAQLPMTPNNGLGPGFDLERGAALYKKNCVDCHGEQGEGNPEEYGPVIQGQHYRYLLREFEWIKNGRRKNSDPEMVKQIKRFSGADMRAVLDYVSRLKPPAEKLGKAEWQNPDFPYYARPPMMPVPPQPPAPPSPPRRPY